MSIITHTSSGTLNRLLWPFRDATGEFSAAWLAAADLILWVGWFGALQLFVYMPPATGLVWVLLVGSAFLWRYALSDTISTTRRHLALPTGPGGAPAGIVAIAALAFAAFGQFWSLAYSGIPGMEAQAPVRWAGYDATPLGVAVTVVLLVVMTPLMEEFCFRGWIMPALARRYGSGAGIVLSSLLFGLTHSGPEWATYYVVPGLILALAIHVSGSIWTGVLLHGGYNALGLVLDPFFPSAESFARAIGGLGAGSWSAPLGLAVTGTLLGWALVRLAPRGDRTALPR